MGLIKRPNELTVKTTLSALIYGQPGMGKAQPLYCNILTPTGFKKLSDLSVGDEVMGHDGKVQKVLGIYPQGIRPVYRIMTNDSAITYCDEEHIWTVRSSTGNSRKAGFKNVTLKEMIAKGISCPLSPSRQSTTRKAIPRYEIPVAEAMDYPEKEYEVNPYILGVLIGDGSLTGNVAMFSNPDMDNQILEEVKMLLPSVYSIRKNEAPQCPQYSIVLRGNGEGYIQKIKRLGLNVHSGDKFIPSEYKLGSREQRLALLRGLMDTDGHANKNRVSFSTSSRILADDFVHLVLSLGGIAKAVGYPREDKGIEYRVTVNMSECPFTLERKAAQWKPVTPSRYIIDAEKIEDSECVCIKVSNEDELYITDDFIVTHNTTLALSAPNPVLFDYDGGIHRVNAAHRVPTVQITSWDETNQVLSSEEIKEFSTIVIDTAGKMLSFMDKAIMAANPKMKKADGTLSLQGYGVRKNMFINFVNQVTLMGKSVIFVAHEREEKVGDEKQIRPEIGGSAAGDLIKELDLVGYMEAIGKDRTISFDPCEKFYGKNTCNLPSRIKIPVIIDESGTVTGKNDFMTNIINTYKGYQTKQTELSSEYDAILDAIRDTVEQVTDVQSANSVREAIAGMTHIFDSKVRAGMLLNEKCKKLGLKFNKLSNKYEPAA